MWRLRLIWEEVLDVFRPLEHGGRIDEETAKAAIYGTQEDRKRHLSVKRIDTVPRFPSR